MPTRVVHIAGTGRSGSTLLATILGSLPGVTNVGELRFLWQRGLVEGGPCGCGASVPACPFWRDVLARAYPDGTPDAAATARLDAEVVRTRHVLALAGRSGRGGARRGVQDYARRMAPLYHALAAGDRLVVDSSKPVAWAGVLAAIQAVEVTTVHLVRDPRGSAYSWLKANARQDRAGVATMARRGALESAALWDVWNLAAERWPRSGDRQRYLRVRYEDLVGDPATCLGGILRALDLTDARPDLPGPDRVAVTASHSVAGNPSRMATGVVTLRPDLAWQTALAPADRRVVTLVTAPLLGHYGYPLRGPGRAPDRAAG